MIVSLPEMLDARERRANRQRELLEKFQKPLVSFTMNIAGPIKDTPLIRRGFGIGLEDLEQVLRVDRIPVLHKVVIREYTGSEAILVVDAPACQVKKLTWQLEESTPLGRLYDMDVLSPDGEKVSGVVKAYNEYEAVSQLREKFTVVTHIEEVKEKKNLNPTFGATRIKDKDLAIMCSQFSIILNSGMSIVRCVEMVAEQARTPELRKMLLKVAEDVSGGYPLAQSFQNNAPNLPVTFVETIRAGEASGTLELCFDRLHAYYDKQSKIRGKVISTLTYPAIVIFVAIVVFIIVMVVAVPMFVQTFAELGTDLPWITKGMIALSNFMTKQ